MKTTGVLLIACVLFVTLTICPVLAHADEVVVGVNWFGGKPDSFPVEQQESILSAMQAAGVHVVRDGISNNDKGFDFLKRAKAHGIKAIWIVGEQFDATSKAPTAPVLGTWRNPGLSFADPDLSKAHFIDLLAKLDQNGIELAGLELDNEFNWLGNGDFPIPGEGRVFGFDDLLHDPEGQEIAKGYLQYIKILAALKTARDQSKINQHTPVISGGLADWGAPGPMSPIQGQKVDTVSIDATLKFLKANGADKFVDAYGVHTYPTSIKVNTQEGAALRMSRLEQNVFAECGADGGKPCWLTEWGFNIDGDTCPVNDTIRTSLVREIRNDFSQLAQQGRIKGLIFFDWGGDVHGREDHAGAVRCGSLTESAKLAFAPM